MSVSRGSNDYEELTTLTAPKPAFKRKTWLIRAVGVCVLLGLFLATSLTLGRKENLHKVLIWIHEHRAAGFFIFGLLYIWFTVLFLPPALLAACAGAIYGFLVAIPLVWACAVLGETISFLLGRFLLKRWVGELTADWPMWTALDAALSEDGWKLVALLRVSPVVPFSIINYALGSSSLPFAHYFWPSVLGIIPGLIIYVYLGSLAVDVSAAIGTGGAAAPPAAKIAITVICAVSALVVVVLTAVYTKRAIDRRLAHVHLHEEVQVEEQHYLLGEAERGGVMVSVETPVLVVGSHRGSSSSSTRASAATAAGPAGAGAAAGTAGEVAGAAGTGPSSKSKGRSPWGWVRQQQGRSRASDDGDEDGDCAGGGGGGGVQGRTSAAPAVDFVVVHTSSASHGLNGSSSSSSRHVQAAASQPLLQQAHGPGRAALANSSSSSNGVGNGRNEHKQHEPAELNGVQGVAAAGSKAIHRRGSKGDLQR